MNKLEEKLIELGYKLEIEEDGVIAYKDINANADIVIGIYDNKISSYYVYSYFAQHIRKQDTIDNLQEAFDIMEKDLAILKDFKDEDEKS